MRHLLQVKSYNFEWWQRRKTLPRLSALLKMCYILDLSLLDLFCGKIPQIPVRIDRATTEKFVSETKLYRRGAPINDEECERALQTALAADPPISVSQVANRLGLNGHYYLPRHFSELCAAVSKRYAEYRKSIIAEKRYEAIAEVRRVTREMHANGIALHYRKIHPRLTERRSRGK